LKPPKEKIKKMEDDIEELKRQFARLAGVLEKLADLERRLVILNFKYKSVLF
jgi:hypothetical protein